MNYNDNGLILWQGPSAINGEPIVVILTGITEISDNGKTGDELQTWILPQNIRPDHAYKAREATVCGDCPHLGRSCYVAWWRAPLAVWKCFQRGGYRTFQSATQKQLDKISGRMLRMGSAGDPAAAPLEAWLPIMALTTGRTGYTHRWRHPEGQQYKGMLQASCDGMADYLEATSQGWRCFLVIPRGQQIPSGTAHCAASEERGKLTTCQACHLCDGATANVAIHAHGAAAGRFTGTD